MTQSLDDDALIARFRSWLEEARAFPEETLDQMIVGSTEPIADVGLFRLVEEFTALRHEVKLETKGSRTLQEQIEILLPAIRQTIDQFRTIGPKEEQAINASGRPMAEAIADLDEALERGRLEIEKARDRLKSSGSSIVADLDAIYRELSWFRRLFLRPYHEQARDLLRIQVSDGQEVQFAVLLEGYGLIQGRVRRAMDASQLRRIETIGLPVDPALMTVIEVVESPDRTPGQVVDEVRRGYTWRGRVLRFAEVRAVSECQTSPFETNLLPNQGVDGN